MWLTWRPGQTDWMAMFVAPVRAEVGCGPVCGWTVSSVVERTVVHDVGPGVSSGWAFNAARSFEPAACCHSAGAQPLALQAAASYSVVPCWVPAAATTSVTFARRLGQ
jgi:hypothetical protein